MFVGCDDSDNDKGSLLGSGISQACISGRFEPGPASECPSETLLTVDVRGSVCLCEGEKRGEFVFNVGPTLGLQRPVNTFKIGKTILGVEIKDCSTIFLFDVSFNPDDPSTISPIGDPIGEIQKVISTASGSLDFVIQLGLASPEIVTCPACWTGPAQPGCFVEEEINKPKCIPREDLGNMEEASCLAGSLINVCEPFICVATLSNETGDFVIAIDGFPVPGDNCAAVGCNTLSCGSTTFTDLRLTEAGTPAGTMIAPLPTEEMGQGSFGCGFSFP